MRTIEASEAASALPSLLEEVERGETLVIARAGRAVSRIVPETTRNQAEIERAVVEIKKLRESAGKATVEEILRWRHEGHRF